MKQKISTLLKDQTIQKMIKLFGTFLLCFIIVSIWKWSVLPPQLPLFYSLPKGPDQLGTPYHLLLLPVLVLVLFVVHLLLAAYLYSRKRLAALLLIVIALVCCLLLLITYIKIIFLVS